MDSSTDQLMDSIGSFLDGKILQKKGGDFMHFHENITDGWGEPVDRQTDQLFGRQECQASRALSVTRWGRTQKKEIRKEIKGKRSTRHFLS